MKIAIAGGSGLIGQPLVGRLAANNDVVVLTRNPARVKVGRAVAWDPATPGDWNREIAAADAVINLAGENIGGGRWTESRKRALVESRMQATQAIVDTLRAHPRPERVLVSASAVGYYGSRGDESLDESSAPGDDFLAGLCLRWEAAAKQAEGSARVVVLRFGIVLAKDGGALAKMLLPFRMFAGGPQGSGSQWMSWIARDDVIRMMEWVIESPKARGTFNAVAPNPVRNAEFARLLGTALGRPALLRAPAFALRAALGEMADALLLSSQRVTPARALAEGFRFEDPDLGEALRHELARGRRSHEP